MYRQLTDKNHNPRKGTETVWIVMFFILVSS